MCARLHSADSVREASAHGEKAAQRPRKANGLERHLAGPPPLSWAWNGALSLAERRGRNPRAARNPARNPRLDQSGETRLYRSNSLNRQGCFSQTLLLPGCSSTTASPRLVPRAFKPQLSLTEAFFCSLKMSDRKAVIKNADMSEEMQQVRLEVH